MRRSAAWWDGWNARAQGVTALLSIVEAYRKEVSELTKRVERLEHPPHIFVREATPLGREHEVIEVTLVGGPLHGVKHVLKYGTSGTLSLPTVDEVGNQIWHTYERSNSPVPKYYYRRSELVAS